MSPPPPSSQASHLSLKLLQVERLGVAPRVASTEATVVVHPHWIHPDEVGVGLHRSAQERRVETHKVLKLHRLRKRQFGGAFCYMYKRDQTDQTLKTPNGRRRVAIVGPMARRLAHGHRGVSTHC